MSRIIKQELQVNSKQIQLTATQSTAIQDSPGSVLVENRMKYAKRQNPGQRRQDALKAKLYDELVVLSDEDSEDSQKEDDSASNKRKSKIVGFVKISKSKGEERKFLRNINISMEDLLIEDKLGIRDVQRVAERQRNWNELQLKLGLYKDECGVIRCRGRLANALLPDETKYPDLLPRDHYFTKLIVEQCHTEVLQKITRQFHNLKRRSSKNKTGEVGDVVVIHDDSRSRSKWKTGVVEQLTVGDVEEVRGVKVRTMTNTGKMSRLRRLVQKIYPLKVTSSREKEIQAEKQPDKAGTTRDERPQRKAKNQARESRNLFVTKQSDLQSA
ncbi:hypothetical protein AC249_AIPGENE20860 [Exaiptasia diaphana]|nr:hypothetical protein AC249_AIPGENE20860 [Exaiptasia diaphana]